MRRRKPLTIVGQEGVEELVVGAMDLAYPNLLEKRTFPLEFVTAVPESPGKFWGCDGVSPRTATAGETSPCVCRTAEGGVLQRRWRIHR